MRSVPKRLIKVGGNQHEALCWLCAAVEDVDTWVWAREANKFLSLGIYQKALDGLVKRGCIERRHGGEVRVTAEGIWQWLKAKQRGA